jgi:hypothetical protein
MLTRSRLEAHSISEVPLPVTFVLINQFIFWTATALKTKPTITETIRLNRLPWFGHVQKKEENRITKKVLYMNLERTMLRCGPRNR